MTIASAPACAPNLRDLGGIDAGGGRTIRANLVFRSEHLSPEHDDAACIAQIGIRSVIDLRSARERQSAPNTWLRAQGADIHEINVTADFRAAAHPIAPLLDDPGAGGATTMMLNTYRALPHAAAPAIALAGRLILDGRTPLLIHCTAGKDRTGFVCAMLLAAVGARPAAIMQDYLASNGRGHPRVSAATRALMKNRWNIDLTDAALNTIIGVEPQYLNTALAVVAAEHGSPEAYLAALGLNCAALRTAMTQ